jgi:hypothetical protein
MLIDAPDPRHDLSAWPFAEQPASASQPLFAPHACGVCGFAECNATATHGVWVRRAGPYVLLLPPHSAAFAVDALAYARAFGGDIEELPAISAEDRARYEGWVEPPEDPSRWVDDGGGVLMASPYDDDDLAAILRWPEPSSCIPVAPPPRAVVLHADPPGHAIHVAFSEGHWSIYAPEIALAVWLGGRPVDSLLARSTITWR